MVLVRNGFRELISEANYGSNGRFDKLYGIGEKCRYEGIYKCIGCGTEAAVQKGQIMPNNYHHTHTEKQGIIAWQLLVYAQVFHE